VHVRQLVQRGSREAVPGTESLQQGPQEQQTAVVVDVRVAQVHPHRVAVVLALDLLQACCCFIKRLVPADPFPPAGCAPQRVLEPIGVFVNVLESDCLGTEVSPSKWISLVPPDRLDRLPLEDDVEAADGLAEVAGAEMMPDGFRRCHRRSSSVGYLWSVRVLDHCRTLRQPLGNQGKKRFTSRWYCRYTSPRRSREARSVSGIPV
jgi:hypothetical protein